MDDMDVRRIVVVVEDVEVARTALQWTLHNLLHYGDLITLLHVFSVAPSSRSNKKTRLLLLKGFQLALSFKDICNNFFNTNVEIIVTEGDQAGGRIAAMVREIGAFALVLGLHDQSFLYKFKSMNPTEKQALLNGARIVNAQLRDDTALFEHKILQTENGIQLMQVRVLELTLVQDQIYAEEEGDEAVAAMKSIGDCLTDLGSALAHVEQERAHLELALKNVSTASEYLNRFENGVAGIPDN